MAVFNGATPNLNWAVNKLNKRISLIDTVLNTLNSAIKTAQTLIDSLNNAVTGIQEGSGIQASNQDIEYAVEWLVDKASNNFITYSQENRNLKNVNGHSYDCSSFIITGFYAYGIDIDATWTGDMREGFTKAGWQWIEGKTFYASELRRGDILLNETDHTQMYIGHNQDVNCGSTPAAVVPHVNTYTYNGANGWDGILRYNG